MNKLEKKIVKQTKKYWNCNKDEETGNYKTDKLVKGQMNSFIKQRLKMKKKIKNTMKIKNRKLKKQFLKRKYFKSKKI